MKKIPISEAKKPIVGGENINYIHCYSVKFRRTTSGSIPFNNQETILQPDTLVVSVSLSHITTP
jgi:hypothetical protein